MLLPNEIIRVDGHPAPAFDDVCRRLLSDRARLDGELVTDAYLVEEHVHRAFNEELDDVQRLRLGTLLCAIYIRLGHGPTSLLVLRYLCAIWVLLNSGVASGSSVTTPGGFTFGARTMSAYWDGVDEEFGRIRETYPWELTWPSSRPSHLSACGDDFCPRRPRRVMDPLDPWDFHGSYDAQEQFERKTASSRRVLVGTSIKKFRNRYRGYWRAFS